MTSSYFSKCALSHYKVNNNVFLIDVIASSGPAVFALCEWLSRLNVSVELTCSRIFGMFTRVIPVVSTL